VYEKSCLVISGRYFVGKF
jgi:inositol 1,4,5-triphosphate receptor type 1